MAITLSPGASESESPIWITTGFSTLTFNTARSVLGSVPTIAPWTLVPSVKTTVSFASSARTACDTTWWLVRM